MWDEEEEKGDGKEVLGRRTVAFVLVVKSQALALLHLL